jgi:deoxyribodipyrimidine photo-lyase
MQIVWFKRDLRLYDNEALLFASKNGPLIPLYIFEEELWQQPDMSYRHLIFLIQSLKELQVSLEKIKHLLLVKTGKAEAIFSFLLDSYQVKTVISHQETWNNWTYQRDRRLRLLFRERGVSWFEFRQNGVIRRLKSRSEWANRWDNFVNIKPFNFPDLGNVTYDRQAQLVDSLLIQQESFPSTESLGLKFDGGTRCQIGGRLQGLKVLKSFIFNRSKNYFKDMSSPLTAFHSCSRISPHIAFGTVSIREIYHAIKEHQDSLGPNYNLSFKAFLSRLYWHCHFIQKLEDEPSLELYELHSGYRNIRDNNDTYFQAWCNGQTGFPLIDACMRCLKIKGWLNFRMRALVTSFASYNLWLKFNKPAQYLAKLFTDYEPGIHYSQIQMQSGTTGINAVRLYCPIKQSREQDPKGEFIKEWVPELKHLSGDLVHTPWLTSDYKLKYRPRIVDEATSRKIALASIFAIRKNPSHKAEAEAILLKHGSRKVIKKRKNAKKAKVNIR